jgi:hypothetical protein
MFNKKELLWIIPIVFLFAVWSFIVLYLSSSTGIKQISKNNSIGFDSINNLFSLIIFNCIITPIIEEISYRLPIRFKNFNLYYFLFIFSIILILIQNKTTFTILFLVQILLLISSLIFFFNYGFKDSKISNNLNLISILSAFAFSLNHVTKYNIQNNYFNFIIILFIVILQYIPFSFYLTYIRLKYFNGLIYCILTHSIFNIVALTFLYLSIYFKM